MSSMEELRCELLTDIATHMSQILTVYGIAQDRAEQAGAAVADFIAEHWGGQTISIPMNYRYKLVKRDLEILSKFTGNNHPALAREYGHSLKTIYLIIKRAKKYKSDHNQPSLFPDAS